MRAAAMIVCLGVMRMRAVIVLAAAAVMIVMIVVMMPLMLLVVVMTVALAALVMMTHKISSFSVKCSKPTKSKLCTCASARE